MGMSQKIAVICNYELLPQRVGGMDYFFWMFDQKCKENGIQVDWFFPNISDHGAYPKLTLRPNKGLNPENAFLAHAANETYSHVITHFVELCTPFFRKAKKMTGAKIIAVDHNPRPILGYPIRKKIEKKVKGLLYSSDIDRFVGVSHYTKTELIKDFGPQIKPKTTVIYNGVLYEDILPRERRQLQKPCFLVASHLRESKGIQDLIQAVALMDAEVKNGLVIAVYGDGPYKETLLKMVDKNQLTAHFQFMGSRPDLKQIYCQYDYMLQPTHMECFSLSILESLAANVPVITTSVGGNEEAVQNGVNGYIVKPKDIAALSQVITQVFTAERHLSGNTRSLIAHDFSLKLMVENHFKLLQTAL